MLVQLLQCIYMYTSVLFPLLLPLSSMNKLSAHSSKIPPPSSFEESVNSNSCLCVNIDAMSASLRSCGEPCVLKVREQWRQWHQNSQSKYLIDSESDRGSIIDISLALYLFISRYFFKEKKSFSCTIPANFVF